MQPHSDGQINRLENLYSVYNQTLFYIANDILQDDFLSEDAVEEAYIRVLTHIDKVDLNNTPAAKNFLAIVCRNVAINMYNDRKRAVDIPLPFDYNQERTAIDSKYSPERILISRETTNEIVKIIDSLPPIYKDILELRRFYMLSEADTASICGVSVNTVKSRMQRLKAVVKVRLGEVLKDEA